MLKSDTNDLFRVLFLDIETAARKSSYEELSDRMKDLWDKKCSRWKRTDPSMSPAELYQDKAAIFAEFGQIICISAGYFHKNEEDIQFKMKSWYGRDEYNLLQSFSGLIDNHFNTHGQHGFCGHNIKEFDIPYFCRRLLVHQLNIPEVLNLQGKKPWEIGHLYDTLEMWKFGDHKHYISLDLMAAVFDIPSPKESLDGTMVSDYYYRDRMDDIVTYCEKDVLTTVNIFLRLLNLSPEFEVIQVQNQRYD